tara:strand:- start:1228 stop:2019 length:792 start_codon:yes stop_codon:yes gene_type:complete
MKNIVLIIFTFNFIFTQVEQPYPPLKLVSLPTGGTLPKGTYTIETLLMNNGGILPSFSLGITDNLTFGVSFGLQEFIGIGSLKKNKSYPEVNLKYRVYDESEAMPAVLIGLDTQGKGRFIDREGYNRYEYKAMGVYCVLSRNYNFLGNLGFHMGLNKNLFENDDKDDDMNLFFGFDKELNRSFSILAEYNLARDDDNTIDDDSLVIRKGRGYLNAGLRWSATTNLMLEININDITKNNEYSLNNNEVYDSMNREVKIIYFENF